MTTKVTHVAVTKQTPEGARVEVTVEVKNPNSYPLPVVGADYKVNITGLKPFDFHTIPAKSLPAKGTQEFIFPAAFATPKDRGDVSKDQYTVTGSIRVQPPGKLWKIATNSGWPHPEAEFSAKGSLSSLASSTATEK